MQSKFRKQLPQLSEDIFLADAGIETDLIFNHGIHIREFAAHTLLTETSSREAVANYFREFLSLAGKNDAGFILDTQTWKAHAHWADDLDVDDEGLRHANRDSVEFISSLRNEFSGNAKPIVLNGIIGPRGDAYSSKEEIAEHEAEEYHSKQIGWLAETEVDMVTATTFIQSSEAIGFVRAARAFHLPVVVSFTVETDGRLPTGQPLLEAIRMVDDATDGEAAYFMVNCAHPDHFFHVLSDSEWTRRIRGLRCNASRLSHEELDECQTLDSGDPDELAGSYRLIFQKMPWLRVFGGCCGTDLRHVNQIARSVLKNGS